MRRLLRALREDLQANSPGAQGARGVLHAALFSHGFQAVTSWRFASYLYKKGGVARAAGRTLSYWHAIFFGVHISPTATIGRAFALPHPMGVGIGEGAVIGDHAIIYHNVTIGRVRDGVNPYPRLGDRVIVYAGAVLAGRIEVADGAIIGPNAIVTRSLETGEMVLGAPARRIPAQMTSREDQTQIVETQG
jgi:serine O-acetyltransferase